MALRGEFSPPGDTSISHRLVLISLLAEGEMNVSGLSDSEDVKTSLAAFRALGGDAQGGGSRWTLTGLGGKLKIDPSKTAEIDCRNSGTTIRLLSGILAGLPGSYLLDGDEQLRRRPMERVADPLRQMGAGVETSSGRAPVKIKGTQLHGIEYINNDSSAQIKGAVLLAAVSANSPSKIVEAVPTRDHTERMISDFGGKVTIQGQTLEITPGHLTMPTSYEVARDPSSAAFFLVGAAMLPGSRVQAKNILLSGERIGFLKVLDRMGASVSISMGQEKPEPSGNVTVEYKGVLTATEITREEIPSLIDEIPILALAAASAEGTTVFRQVRELRLKETDRLTAIKHQLGALGARVWVENDDLFVQGPTKVFLPESLDSNSDHRLAMMLRIALVKAGATVPIIGEESIAISYPSFNDDLAILMKS